MVRSGIKYLNICGWLCYLLGEDIYGYLGYLVVIWEVSSLYRRLGLKFSTLGTSSVPLILPNVRSFALGTIMCVAIKNDQPSISVCRYLQTGQIRSGRSIDRPDVISKSHPWQRRPNHSHTWPFRNTAAYTDCHVKRLTAIRATASTNFNTRHAPLGALLGGE